MTYERYNSHRVSSWLVHQKQRRNRSVDLRCHNIQSSSNNSVLIRIFVIQKVIRGYFRVQDALLWILTNLLRQQKRGRHRACGPRKKPIIQPPPPQSIKVGMEQEWSKAPCNIRIIQEMCRCTMTRVMTIWRITNSFTVRVGVHQDPTLS